MSTNSLIAIGSYDENNKLIIKSVYCHWDGFVEYNGKVLFENYPREQLEKLIALGNISSLDVNIKDTKFYNRDLDHDETEFETYDSLSDYINTENYNSIEFYYYLSASNIWYVKADEEDEFKFLSNVLSSSNILSGCEIHQIEQKYYKA